MLEVSIVIPLVEFIESNEVRGFSENNNLALRQAMGKYCFVMNDDTEMNMPVVDKLVYTKGNFILEIFLRILIFVGVGINLTVHCFNCFMKGRANFYSLMSIGDKKWFLNFLIKHRK